MHITSLHTHCGPNGNHFLLYYFQKKKNFDFWETSVIWGCLCLFVFLCKPCKATFNLQSYSKYSGKKNPMFCIFLSLTEKEFQSGLCGWAWSWPVELRASYRKRRETDRKTETETYTQRENKCVLTVMVENWSIIWRLNVGGKAWRNLVCMFQLWFRLFFFIFSIFGFANCMS